MKKSVSLLIALIILASAFALPGVGAEGARFDSSAVFIDVPVDAWFRNYVDFVASRGIMGGDGKSDTFMPQNISTRAMIAVILHRFEGKPTASDTAPFLDITGDWYIAAVNWAYGAGIIKGKSPTAFCPDTGVTRQELVTLLFRYASVRSSDISGRADVSAFPDGADVAEWALDPMKWAIDTGLIVGRNGGGRIYLAPEDFITRCELATVLYRFIPMFDDEKSGEDRLFSIADSLKAAETCADHGAVLHILAGSPGNVTDSLLGTAIVDAFGLDPSIYDVTLSDGCLDSFVRSYSMVRNGEFATVSLSFAVDNVRTAAGPVAFDSLPVAVLRNDRYSVPRAVRCDSETVCDEELEAMLDEFESLYSCPRHGCVHIEAESLTKDLFAHAVADLMGLDEGDYSVVPEDGSLSSLKNKFDALGVGEITDTVPVLFSVRNEAIKRECGYDAVSGSVSVNFTVMKRESTVCRAVNCPYEEAERATELFMSKYVCREHGKAHVSLNYSGHAKLSDIETLLRETLDLGENHTVTTDGESFAEGTVRTKIVTRDGYETDGPEFTPVYTVDKGSDAAARFTLCDNERDAYKLIVHDGYSGNTGYGSWNSGQTESGWKLDTRGDDGVRHGTVNDVSTTESCQVIREVNVTSKGILDLRTAIEFRSGFDGAILDFRNADGDSVFELRTAGGSWKVPDGNGAYRTVYEPCGETRFVFDVKIDLLKEYADVVINDRFLGPFPLSAKGVNVNIGSFRFSTTKEDTVSFDLDLCDASVNYDLLEYFAEHHCHGELPAGWSYSDAYIVPNTGFLSDARLFDHYLGVGTGGFAEISFSPADGRVIVRFSVLPAASGSDTEFEVLGGGGRLISVYTDEDSFYVNGEKAYDYVENVWYYFYLLCDVGTGEISLKINGIDRGVFSMAETGVPFDAVRVTNSGAPVTYDAFTVYRDVSHGDYVPEPVRPEGGDEYTVGINTCSMWQNGFHAGWACITPYDDIRPILGYYDEGSPETADWEIKYMVEHGIDFQSFVLFAVQETGPVTTGLGVHLEDGYKYAKYNDMLDYCLIWCSASSASPKDMDAWRDYFVPYLIENHFKDPHYLVIDNKPVLQTFRFIDSRECPYWTSSKRKEAFDYLDAEVRKLGFDGMIYITEEMNSDSPSAEGIDGLYSYNHGQEGTSFERLKIAIENNSAVAESEGICYVPTSAIGFNCVGWMNERTPLMTPSDFRKSNEWIRDVYLPEKNEKAPAWAKNLTIVCTWNEYGEGHYLMPCDGLEGFSYLDVLRETFTAEKADESINLRPTEAHLERINRLYPQHLRLIRAQEKGTYTNGVTGEVPLRNEMYEWVDEIALEPNVVGYDDNLTFEDGVISNDSSKYGSVTIRLDTVADISKCAFAGANMYVPSGKSATVYTGTGEHEDFNRLFTQQRAGNGTVEDFTVGISPDAENQAIRVRLPAGARLYGVKLAADTRKYFPYGLNVLDSEIPYKVLPEISPRGDYLFGFDTIFTDLHLFGMFAEWDSITGTLKLSFPGNVFVFTVGSAFYTLNGERYYLGYRIKETDGVPMIPLNIITDRLGYKLDCTDIRNAAVFSPG